MFFERVCPACGQPTNAAECVVCGNETQERSLITATPGLMASAIYSPADGDSPVPEGLGYEPPTEVVFLKSTEHKPARRRRVVRWFVRTLFLYDIPIMCLWLAIAGYLRFVFILGFLFGIQPVFLYFRAKSLSGPIVDDDAVKARLTPPILELCAILAIPAPRVRVQQSLHPAAMTEFQKAPLLCISPDFLEAVDDRELRAIIAHELIHQKARDVTAAQGRAVVVGFTIYLAFIFIVFTTSSQSLLGLAVYLAFFSPLVALSAWASGFWWRSRELHADLEGVKASKDPEAAIGGLYDVYALIPPLRRNLYGPSSLRWLLFPYCLRARTHPPLEDRVAAIRALPLVEEALIFDAPEHHSPPRRQLVLVAVVALIAVIGLTILIRHLTSDAPSISKYVESPGGAHFIPVSDLGIPSNNGELTQHWHFSPLVAKQVPQVTTTAQQALSTANGAIFYAIGETTPTIAEGSFAGVTISALSGNPFERGRGTPSYLVVVKGTYIEDPQNGSVSDFCVVVVNATNDTVESTWFYNI
jgi:heat shock protein HtpX